MYRTFFHLFYSPRFFAVLAGSAVSLLLYSIVAAQGLSITETQVRPDPIPAEDEAFRRSFDFFSRGDILAALTVIAEYEKNGEPSERITVIHALSAARLERYNESDRLAETLEHSSHKFSALFLRAAIEYHKKNFERAEEKFSELKTNAESEQNQEWIASSEFWLGETSRARSDREQAIEHYRALVTNFPSSQRADDALLRLGELYERSERYDSAAISYLRLINTYPSSEILSQTETRLASVYIYEHLPLRALEELDRAEHTAIVRGAIEYDEERTSTAVEAFSEFSPRSDSASQILTKESHALRSYLRAEALIQLGKHKEAFEECIKALEPPSILYDRKLRFTAALAAMNMGNFADARSRFATLASRTAEVQGSPQPQVHELHDEFYVGITDTLGQQQAVQSVDDIGAQAEFYEALALERLGKTSEANSRFELIARNESHPMASAASFERASMLLERGNVKEARRAAADAVRGARGNAALASRIYLVAAEAAYADGDVDEARKYFGESVARSKSSRLALDDVHSRALLGEGVSLVQTKHYADAVPVLQEFLASKTQSTEREQVEGYFWAGEAYLNLNLFTNARESYNTVLNSYKGSEREEDALYSLAWANYRAGELGQASRAFARLANTFPSGRYVFEANARAGDAFYLLKQYDNASAYYDAALKVTRLNRCRAH